MVLEVKLYGKSDNMVIRTHDGRYVNIITFLAERVHQTENKGPEQYYVVGDTDNCQTNRAFSHLAFAKDGDLLELSIGTAANNLGGPSLIGFGTRAFSVKNVSRPIYNI